MQQRFHFVPHLDAIFLGECVSSPSGLRLRFRDNNTALVKSTSVSSNDERGSVGRGSREGEGGQQLECSLGELVVGGVPRSSVLVSIELEVDEVFMILSCSSVIIVSL